MVEALVIALAYLIGSIPFAFLLSRRRGVDLRTVGSGNIGAANVLRTSGASTALAAVLLDALKGAAAVGMAQGMAATPAAATAAGLASVVGHIYPVWLRFRGGKGVATAAGVFGVLSPIGLAGACAVFLVVVGITRFVSVGSMAAAVTLAIITAVSDTPPVVAIGAGAAAAMIIHRHRANLGRLLDGTERKVGNPEVRSK